jgi:hypothetical protein
VPSRQKAYTNLLEQEPQTSNTGITELLRRGLELEDIQYEIWPLFQ